MEMIKKRLTNPIFYVNTLIGIAAIVGGYFGLTGADFTTWSKLFETIQSALGNPYVIGMIVAYVYGVIVNTDSKGFTD